MSVRLGDASSTRSGVQIIATRSPVRKLNWNAPSAESSRAPQGFSVIRESQSPCRLPQLRSEIRIATRLLRHGSIRSQCFLHGVSLAVGRAREALFLPQADSIRSPLCTPEDMRLSARRHMEATT